MTILYEEHFNVQYEIICFKVAWYPEINANYKALKSLEFFF